MKKSKPKRLKIVNEKTLIVAVDIGKEKNTGYCRCPDGTELKPFEFANNGPGLNEFWSRVERFKACQEVEAVVVGYESTGCYAEPLIHFLKDKPVTLGQVNPMHTSRVKELQGNSPNKTDQKDPRVIADIIALGHVLTVVIPEGAAAELRRLVHARERSLQRRGSLFNQLHDLVFIIFPEFVQIMDISTKSGQYLINHYGTPGQIIECGVEALAEILKKVSRGKLGYQRARALDQAACKSAGVREGAVSIVFEIKECLRLIEACDRFIRELEEKMANYLKQIPYSGSLRSIKGIGAITAAGLIGEVGDFRKFRTISEILKHGGLDLFEISSGKHRGQRRISKRGRPLMRKLLFYAAINVVRKGGVMHERYQRYLQRGMPKIKGLVAIMRKLLAIMFALVRDHSQYVAGYTKPQPLLTEAA